MTINADLTGRRVLVAGGSSGLGRAIALSAAAAGATTAVAGRREALLDEAVKEAAEAGGGSMFKIVADLTDEAAAERAVDEAVAGLGGLDAVLAPLATAPLGYLVDTDAATWLTTFATNVVAPSLVTKNAVRVLAEGGFIGYVSSINAATPMHGLGAYGASKAALEHSVRTWRLEHPDRRFLTLVIGNTLPTDLYRNFDHEVIGRVLTTWAEHGLMQVTYLPVGEVGLAVVEAAEWILSHPGICVEDIVLKPPARAPAAGEVEAIVKTYEPGNDVDASQAMSTYNEADAPREAS